MPRRTAPPARRTHTRAHIRHQRLRWTARHRRLARALDGLDGWPLSNPRIGLARNPFNRCSCNLCSGRHLCRGTDRMIARRAWRREVREALVERTHHAVSRA
jgi:hypothetical protein